MWPSNAYYRVAKVLRETEREYGLRVTVKADRAAARGLTRAEKERSVQTGREPVRSAQYRHVRTAESAARTKAEYFAALEARALKVRLRPSQTRPGEVTGYSVAADHGPGQRAVWYGGGGKLAPGLTLPKLQVRLRPGPAGPPGRLLRHAARPGRQKGPPGLVLRDHARAAAR